MRRSLAAALALFAAAVLCIGAAFASVSPAKDNIEYTQETVFGDPNVLEGLNVRTWLQYGRRLCWKSDVHYEKTGGETRPAWTTEFHRLKGEVYQNLDLFGESINEGYAGYSYSGVQIFSDPMYALDRRNDGWIDKIFEGKDPDEEIHTEIKLKDFIDYYPVYGTVDLPGLFYSIDILYFDPEELRDIKEKEAAEPYAGELETALAINEFFRIPVLEEETVIFDGYSDSYNTGSKDNTDSFYLYTEGVCTEDKCLFWFSNRTNKDNTVDCSLIPGGYGIYCLPFKNTEESGKGFKVQKTEIFPDKLANVYPLDEESTVMDISLDKDGKLLRMVSLDKDKMFRLSIIDTESFECLQVTDIGPADENEWCIVKSEDNFIVCIEDDSTEDEGTLHVYYDPGSGVYEERICIPMDYSDENSADSFAWLSGYKHSIAFDGKRLACSNWNVFEFENEKMYGPGVITRDYTANLRITVYDAEGMQYAGNLIASLDKCNQYAESSLDYKYYKGEYFVFEDHWTDTLLSWD